MFNGFCKICGQSRDVVNVEFYPLYNSSEETKRLTGVGAMFFQCIFRTFRVDPNYPEYVCQGCKLRLTEFYYFRQMALKTHTIISEFLKNTKFLNFLTRDDFREDAESKNQYEIATSENVNENNIESENENGMKTESDNTDYTDQFENEFGESNVFLCTICNRNFKTAGGLTLHRTRLHLIAKSKRTFRSNTQVCKVCGKQFAGKDAARSVRAHELRHTDLRSSICKFCKKSFKCKSDLGTHIQHMHYNVKRFICDICGIGLRVKTHLIDHMETHITDQFYKCPHCSIQLKTRKTLISHIEVVHLNVGRFVCLYCNAGFGGKQRLMKHMKVHIRHGQMKMEDIPQYSKLAIPIRTNLRKNINIIKIYRR